ncbi:hypothetical protein [Pandoraea terrigena]|uniref:Uncharacterized protein n=1 Tax=Pandoraea terrigena TaxID=2508292 RepID=A0A5E4UMW4_9BURK|nr:hypothetical protein [Pandoraea terrigena]VVE00215.1 hypothetical protein PTE31013_02095 [Pandoraea terrigena]
MTLQLLIPTLIGRARARLSPASTASNRVSTSAGARVAPKYRLVVLTLASRAHAIDTQVRHVLRSHRLTPEAASRSERSGGYLLELDYGVRCEQSRRAALVHLVSTLGDTAGVRAIRWETAPEPPAR